ncbi:MAG: UDP-3-O-(3-hydroxymyristoyl)glucosamine N-acyltransferase [Elusimicrobia bacterium CG1_02_63_36]|nr:MAG: UDP-3-O-(3-hydroxymyristoyl)glucosamine N-acyltransferase [Elusimicrobia bacterium CG1_02_63_36]PIP82703.1 MAG: UDP-3-O-(3-hydroxymyristoyl)glucosamine N-acyltransferase [Elusimicrobia bacterium CG22_combo_CG10-13_8_21_14_all_63_91]PJA11946.1 MAG: UDP-3-O-(3-hydroxymyristoyl)glucosamine N-acyltransferase [Elusimicrobia bacterium CG_4_10_14_0_2_um_filter_63_34]PJB23809.1 MAG: UDP-3-O-(3-hydroxymyristoyl)glucosamine N-acyltransferase [Elusimicrobia bacterium CG_4_9_14_3_um_filter_62_55]
MKLTLEEIARLTGCQFDGDKNAVVTGADGLENAGPEQVSFLENPKYIARVGASKAAAVFLPNALKDKIEEGPANRFYCDQPRWAYAQILAKIHEEKWKPEPVSISEHAEISPEARLGKGVGIGSFTVVKARTMIGDGTRVAAQVHIGFNARIGKNCVLHPQVVIGDYCELGDNVIVHPGAVIGAEGYGYWTDPKTGTQRKVAQVGRVVIEDDCEIHSNVTIDRATTGETRIGAGTMIDNLVQIGHNCTTGPNCLIISQTGLAGSTKLGRQVILAGQVGVAGHLTIGDGAVVTAQTGVMSDVAPKSILFGSPARPHREAMKLQALMNKLPEMYDALKKVKALLSKGEKETAHAES